MREIKFRYTCKRENGHTFSRIFTLEQIESSEVRQWWELNHIGKTTIHKDLYTGLKDKNGKEAYHKDIIKDSVLGELWLIEWSDEYACFELQRITENTIKVKGILETISACRIIDLGVVIGNIYENPELLK